MRLGSIGGLVFALMTLASASSLGCAASPALRAAEAHDLPALAREIAAAQKSGGLSAGEARDIARAVAEHEVTRAKGDAGVKAVHAFSRCARALDGAYEARGAELDDIAAAASSSRLEDGLLTPDAARELASRPGVAAGWRLITVRALLRPEDGAARRARFVDGDQEVRAAALRAAADAGDVADTELLLEAARLDPYPLARALAVRAVARAASGERAVLALRDLWTQADEDLRQSIADAWSTERNIEAGGRRELWWAAEHGKGAAAIAAASALARFAGEGRPEAIGVLARAVKSGPTNDRVYAIGVAPAHEPPIEEALRAAVNDEDEAVAVAASWRLLTGVGREVAEPKDRKAIIERLMKLAKTPTTRGFQAQKALARAGVREVLPFVEKQFALQDTRAREATGVALVDLRELSKAVVLVADADLGVRAAVACAILQAPKE